MRRSLRPAVLFVLVLTAYALLGVAVADATPSTAANVTVSGQVTDDDGRAVGDAHVLLEPADGDLLAEHTDGEQAVVESVLKLARTDPDGVTVVRADGRFSASVPAGRYRAVAVTRERISAIREVDATGGATVDLAVDSHRVLRLDAGTAGPVAPGSATTVDVRVANPDDGDVDSLSVSLGDLPTGWTLAGVETNGSYDADARRVAWERVRPGENVTATLHVRVPADAEGRHYRVPLTADSDSHFVEAFDDGRVVVRPANATPTQTSVGDPANATTTPRVTGALTATPSPWPTERGYTGPPPTATTSPGFGPAVVLAAVAVLAVALRATESR